MDLIPESFLEFFDSNPTFMLGLFVFLAVSTLAFGVMAAIRLRSSVKRRAAEISSDSPGRSATSRRSLRYASVKAAQRLIDYTTKNYSESNERNMRILRRRMIQAGFLDSRAAAFFFIARTALAVSFGVAAFFFIPVLLPDTQTTYWLLVGL